MFTSSVDCVCDWSVCVIKGNRLRIFFIVELCPLGHLFHLVPFFVHTSKIVVNVNNK